MKSFLLLSFILLLVLSIPAQNFHSKLYSAKEGLSNENVSSLLMDEEGFLWVGTASGLNRFDGNAFEIFRNRPSDPFSIGDNNIQKLFTDNKGQLWIGTNAGISLYHSRYHTFSNYAPDTVVLPQQGISYQAINQDSRNNLWVGTKNDLLIFDQSSKKFRSSRWSTYAESVTPQNSNRFRVLVLGLLKKASDEMWILSTYGLFSVNTSTLKFHYYPSEITSDFFGFRLDYADQKGMVWLSSAGSGIVSYDSFRNRWNQHITKSAEGSFETNSIVGYSGDTLAYTVGSSIYLYESRHQQELYTISFYDSTVGKPHSNVVGRSIVKTPDVIWVGTTKGLIKLSSFNSPFHFVPLTTSDDATDKVFALPDSGTLLFTSIKNNFSLYLKKQGASPVPVRYEGAIIHAGYLYVTKGRQNHYYLNDDEHLFDLDVVTNTVESLRLPPLPPGANSYDIRNSVKDKRGTLWIRSLTQGVLKYSTQSGMFSTDMKLTHHPNKETNALYYDSLTDRLFYTEEFNGLYEYDLSKKSLQYYNLNRPPSQRSAAIIYITGDGKGHIWLSDLQAGLLAYNAVSGIFKRITEIDGLASNNCSWTAFDQKKTLWVFTDNGLCKYVTNTNKWTIYNQSNGYDIIRPAFLSTDTAGNLYMPYKNGFFTWSNSSEEPVRKKGRVYLRDALLFDQHLPSDTGFVFSHDENNLRFLFGLLSLDRNSPVTIQYSLNGANWVSSEINSYIAFPKLSPGNYTLVIRTSEEDIPFHIQFLINKPVWQRWWFIAIVAMLAGALITVLVRKRIARFKAATLLQEQLLSSQMAALQSQMNPHFIFNTLNSINSYILENKPDAASEYLHDFSSLIRIILTNSQKKTVPLEKEIKALTLYLELESKRLEEAFDYSITIDDNVDTIGVMIPPLTIQPFAENAIWHGLRGKKGMGHLRIAITNYEAGILILVEDDGVGRVASAAAEKMKETNSFGTEATTKRLWLNHPKSYVKIEDLYSHDGEPCGTMVRIYLFVNIYFNGNANN